MRRSPPARATLLVLVALSMGALAGCLAASPTGPTGPSGDDGTQTENATAPSRYLLAEFPDDPDGAAGNVMTPSVHQDGGRVVGAVDDPAKDTIHLGFVEDGNLTREQIPIGQRVQQLQVVTWHDRTFLAYRTSPDPGGSQSIVLVHRRNGTWRETAVTTDRVGSGLAFSEPIFRTSADELILAFNHLNDDAVGADGLTPRHVLRLTPAVTPDGFDPDAIQRRRFDDGPATGYVAAMAVHETTLGVVYQARGDDLVYAHGRWAEDDWSERVIYDEAPVDMLRDGTDFVDLAYGDDGRPWVRRTPRPHNVFVPTGDSWEVFLSRGPGWNWTATSVEDHRRFGAEAADGSLYLSAYDRAPNRYSINRWNGTGQVDPLMTSTDEWQLVENATGPMSYVLTRDNGNDTRQLVYAPDAARLSSG